MTKKRKAKKNYTKGSGYAWIINEPQQQKKGEKTWTSYHSFVDDVAIGNQHGSSSYGIYISQVAIFMVV